MTRKYERGQRESDAGLDVYFVLEKNRVYKGERKN